MLNDNDIVITRQQLEAWATAIGMIMERQDEDSDPATVAALEQALEDMTDELADPDEIDIVDDADLYDPDAVSDGWIGDDDDDDFHPSFV